MHYRQSPHLLFLLYRLFPVNSINYANIPCGQSNEKQHRDHRILGGTPTNIEEVPFVVSLQRNGAPLCGGSIIHEKIILTAAHCVIEGQEKEYSIVVGSSNLSGFESEVFNVTQIRIHSSYKASSFVSDLALLILEGYLTWSQRVQPICVSDQSEFLQESKGMKEHLGRLSGWGFDNERKRGGRPRENLVSVELPILSHPSCQNWFDAQRKGISLSDKHLCAGYFEGEKDGCQGDSGGGLAVQWNERWTLVGIMSAGIGCGRKQLPGIYTKISAYSDWLEKIIIQDSV